MIIIITLGICVAAIISFIFICNIIVIHTPIHEIKLNSENNVMYNLLILGAPPKRKNGTVNPYLTNRLDKAIEAFKADKTDKIIISGKNSKSGKETLFMKDYLLINGVKEVNIIEDEYGLKTKESILFCKRMNIGNIAIVTQSFHAKRACYIAQKARLDSYVMLAKDVKDGNLLKVHMREILSRCKAVIS